MPSPAAAPLDRLPAPWRGDRLVCSRLGSPDHLRLHGDDSGLVMLAPTAQGLSVSGYGAGCPEIVAGLCEAGELNRLLRWIDLPREVALAAPVRDRLRLTRQPGWDWLWTEVPPDPAPVAVVALDPVRDAAAITDCLAEANPQTWGDPNAPDQVGWWGVVEAGVLIGVIGAAARPGGSATATSWHLEGLGVRPGARGRGLGSALTAAATRAGLAAGADWVSLGVWAANLAAIRIYHRLGYRTGHQRASWRPAAGHDAACHD